MPSRLTTLAIIAAVLALLLSPQIASYGTSDSCIVAAPPEFVKQKIIDYDFVHELQATGDSGSLDALRFTRNGHYFTAIFAEEGEYLDLTSPDSKDGTRKAKVVSNTERKFVYREDFGYGQRVVHWISFRASGKRTVLEYDRRWKGSLVMLALRMLNLFEDGIVFEASAGGLEGMRKAINEAWEERNA